MVVNPLAPSGERAAAVSGSHQEIADAFRSFEAIGFTRLEVMLTPGTVPAMEALGRVLEAFDAS